MQGLATQLHPPRTALARCGALAVPLLVLAFASCRAGGEAPPPEGTDPSPEDAEVRPDPDGSTRPATSMAFDTIQQGTQSGFSHALYTFVESEERWQALWARHTDRTLPRPPAPEVDFAAEVAIVLSSGPRPSAGYRLEVTDVRTEGRTLVVDARESAPPADSVQAAVVTTPFHFVRTARFDGPVEFRVQR